MMVDVNARFRYDGNFGPLQAQVKALTRDIHLLNASFIAMDKAAMATKRSLAESFVSNVNATGQFKASFVDLTSATEQFGRSIERRTLTLREYFREARKVYQQDSRAARLAERQVQFRQAQLLGLGTGPNGRTQGIVVRPLSIDTSDYTTKMQLAAEKYAIFNRLVDDGATKLINWGKNTQWAGRQLTIGLTMPLVLFGAAVSKTFRDVDKELTRFAKVYGSDLAGANAKATEEMKRQIQSLAIEYSRAYGIAAKETAALAADLAATGLEGEKLTSAIAQTTRLAVLGEVDRQEAMQTTLALQSAFQQSTKDLAESINFLNAVENQTSASLADFTAAIPKAGPVVRQLGGDVKDLAVMLTAMREGGIPAAEAANAIKSGLAAMINPTKAASERLAKLGVDIQGIVNRNRGELMPTLMEFGGVLNQLDSFARAKVIEELFGKYQFARISALFDNLNRQGSQTAEVMQLMGASSADLAKLANKEIGALTESLSMRFTRAVEGFKASLLPIGEVLTSAFIPFIEGATTVISKMVDIFNALPEPVKNAGKFLIGLTAAAGPLIMLAGVFGNFLGYMTKGVLQLNNFARRLMGLPVERLEILDDQTIAAAKATDLLTDSFRREASSLETLNVQLRNYIANLRNAAVTTPGVFAPGSPARTGRTVRRSTGGDIPGYGGGDKVPALLEPGEFVVRKEVASKNRGFLRDLNSGRVRKYQGGGEAENVEADSGLGRSHVAKAEDSRGRKIFGGLISLENQGYNQAIEQLPGVFPGKNQPVTFQEFERAREKLRQHISSMPSDQIPRYMADAMASMDADYNFYTSQGRENASRVFKEELSKRMAGGTLTVLPKSLASQKDSIFEQERSRLLAILMETDDPDIIRRDLVDSVLGKGRYEGRPVGYAGPTGRMVLLGGRVGTGDKFGKARSSLITSLYEAEAGAPGESRRGNRQVPVRETIDLLRDKDISVYSPGYRAGREQAQASDTVRRPTTPTRPTRPTTPTRPTGALGPRGRIAAGMHPGMRFPIGRGPRPIVRAMPDELLLPPTVYADNGAIVDKDGSVSPLQQRRGMMGSSLMNIGFAGSMLAGMTAMNGEVTAATSALTAFTTALMVAGTAIEMGRMFGGRGRGAAGSGLFGMGRAGAAMGAKGGAMRAAGAASGGIGGFLKSGAGMGMMGAGRALAFAGGPWGMAIAAALAVAVAGVVQFNRIMENMRQSAKASFAEATQSAEYFGIELGRTAERAQEFGDIVESLGLTASATADQIDEDFVQRVGADYESLISRIKGSADIQSVGNDLKLAYSSMIAQGFGADEAKAIVEEVARQAEQRPVYLNIKGNLESLGDDPEKIANSIAEGSIKGLQFARQQVQKGIQDEMVGSIGISGGEGYLGSAAYDFIGGINPLKALPHLFGGDQGQFLDFAGTFDEMKDWFGRMTDPTKRFSVETQAAFATVTNAGEMFGASMNTLFEQFKQFPSETGPAIQTVLGYVEQLDEGQREAFDTAVAKNFTENVADPALLLFYEQLGTTNEDLALKMKLAQAASLGLSDGLSGLMNQGNLTAAAVDELIQKVIMLDNLNVQMDIEIDKGIDALKKQSKEATAAYDDKIKAEEKYIKKLDKEAETAQENHDAYMDSLEDESRALDDRAEKIQENAEKQQELIDKKIKSLQLSQEEATFEQQQRQRAFGVLGALMSGDTGAYETARLEYVQAQEDRQRELAIQGLEDRKEKIADEAEAKLDAIDKEKKAIEDRARAAQDAHEAYLKQNEENQEAAEKRIAKTERERNKVEKAIQQQINLLEQYKAQGYLTEEQVKELNIKLQKMGQKLPAGVRTAVEKISKEMFGPNGDYTRIVNGLVEEMAKALNVSPDQVRTMLGDTLTGQYPATPSSVGNQGTWWSRTSNAYTGRTGESPIPGRASGGRIEGPGTPTSDSILARLSRGEYVVKADSVRKLGTGTLDYINSTGRIPGFAQGSPGGVGAGQTAGGMWGTGPNAMTVLSIRALQDLYGKAVDDIKNTNTTTTTPATNVPTGEGSQWLANFLSSMGLSGEQLRVAYAIAMRESSGRPNLVSTMDGNGYGLFQIQFGVGHANTLNTVLGSNVTDNESDRQKFAQLMFDAQNNFKVMMHMSRNMEDLGAWGLHSWRNPTLNTRDYSKWTASQHQAWIMEPFLKYYASFPGVDPSYTGTTTTTTTGASTAGQAAVNFATSQQGKPYSMTATPPSSWDCSKLTAWAWAVATGADPSRGYYDGAAKVRLTPYSHTQANEIQKRVIGNGGPISGLVPGDILYFRGMNSQSGGHTSMYVGNGQVFEAASPSLGLKFEDVNNSWNQQYFAWGGSPPGYAEGGLIGEEHPIGDKPKGSLKKFIPGFRYGGSADRQEYAASQRTSYYGGTPTSAYSRPSASYYSTPAWTPYNKGLKPQYQNPVPTGRMAGTTKPYSTSGAYTADTATMYSQNYSHKLPAYATTGAHLSYLAAKANKNFGDTTGGRKWKQIASMLASPYNTPAKQRLSSASRGIPTTEYWRTLSREQKDWLIRYATTGNGTGWTGNKPFRIMPWIGTPQARNIPTSRFVDRVDYPTALNAYPNTVTIGQDGVAPTAPGFSDFNDGRVGISTNKSPYGLIPGTNIPVPRPPGAPATSGYPMGWDVTTRVPMDRPAKPSGSNYIWDPQRAMWISTENVGAGTSWGWPWDGSGTKDNMQSPIRFKPGMTPDTTRTSPQEQYPIGMSGLYLGTSTWLGRTLDKFSSGQPLSLEEKGSLNNLYEMLGPIERNKLVAEMYRRSLTPEGSISLRSLNEISNIERGAYLRTLNNETGYELDLIRRRSGGIIPGFRAGGYISADRAETAANNNIYAGGWKPRTTYFGGTPTASNYTSSSTTSSNLTGPYHLEKVVERSNKRGREWWETGRRKSTINSIMRGTGEINAAQRSALAYALSKYGVSLQEGNELSWKRLTRAQKDAIFNATQVSPQRYMPGTSAFTSQPTASMVGPQARDEGTIPYDKNWWTNYESEAKAMVRGLPGGANKWMIEHFLDSNAHHSYRIVPRAADNRPWWQKMLRPAYDDGAGHLKGLYNYRKGGTSPDNILARVSNGEYIMSAPAVSAIGVKNMDMINSGQLPGFNAGGLVKDPRFKLPKNRKIGKISDASTMVREGDRVEYNINIDVAETNASADEIANKVMRQLKVNENSRRLRSNG